MDNYAKLIFVALLVLAFSLPVIINKFNDWTRDDGDKVE